MNEHVLDLLEFPRVRQLVADRTASARGRRRALALHPSAARGEVEEDLARLAQMLALHFAGIDPGPIEVAPLAEPLSRLGRTEEPLAAEELLDLGGFLRLATRVRRSLDRDEVRAQAPAVHALALRFGDFGAIVRRLEEVFDPSGEMLDSASPTLARLRRRLRETRTAAAETLNGLARKLTSRPDETFVTLREGRYVLLVQGADRPRIQGIVHGHSKTGQSAFLEPMEAVEANNAIASLEAEEQEERREILRELTASMRDRSSEIAASYDASEELDFLRARTRLALDLDGSIPRFHGEPFLRLRKARHPLLAEASRSGGGAVVPLDLDLGGTQRTLVLSGPNMGGKTVALKTVGLVCAMAQAGLPVPVGDGTELPFLDGVFADIGDEQSIEQETSTFAGHLRNIGLAWRDATAASLVLLDELGGGTDPEEGAPLGRALLELLAERGSLVLATTHLVALKLLAHEHPRMANAAMEFDAETQLPTYRLKIGSPGRSRAFELARRVLPPGELLDRADGYRSRWSAALDEILQDLERRAAALEQEAQSLERSRRELENASARKELQAQRLRQRLDGLREKRLESAGRSIAEAEGLLTEARRLHRDMTRLARDRAAAPPVEEVREVERRIHAAAERVRRPRDRSRRPLRPELAHAGSWAYSEDLQSAVKIDSEPDASERVWIWHGAIRFRVPIASLREPGEDAAPAEPLRGRGRGVVRGPSAAADIERQIDLRGKSAEEGLSEIERYLDRAAVAGVPEVRIVHGKGKGILKREIEAFLRESPYVESFRTGEPHEGGWGATIVRVRSAQVPD